MGKAKSFIIVGAFFGSLILIIIIITLLSSGNSLVVKFDDYYAVAIDGKIAIAPQITATRNLTNMDFEFIVENDDIVEVKQGSYAKGSNNLSCWSFVETYIEAGNTKEYITTTKIPCYENDYISLKDGYWHINEKSTNLKALRDDYTDYEIYEIARPQQSSVVCWILNGQQTNFACQEGIEPVRGENGNWFLADVDTGYGYLGVQATVYGLKYGMSNVTLKGTMNGFDIEIKTTIEVVPPNPTKVEIDTSFATFYLDKYYVLLGSEFDINCTIIAENSIYSPIQDYTVGLAHGMKPSIVSLNGKKATANGVGETTLQIFVPSSSFKIGGFNMLTKDIKIVVVETLPN